MSWTQAGTANLVNGSAEVVLSGARWDGRYMSVGYGFQPVVAGLPMHEITAIDVDTRTITIDPPWTGSTATAATYKVVPMLGQLQAPAIALENAAQAIQDFGTSGVIKELSVGEGLDPYLKASNQGIEVNVPFYGTQFPEDRSDRTLGRILRVGDLGRDGYPISINSSADLNTFYDTADLYFNGADAPQNVPLQATAGSWRVETRGVSATLGMQVARRLSVATGVDSNNRTFTRGINSTGASDWMEQLTSQNIIGAMSLVGGLSNRILESGMTDTGGWVKLAARGGDSPMPGVMVQWAVDAGSAAAQDEANSPATIWSGQTEWVFPKAFHPNSKTIAFSSARTSLRWGGASRLISATKANLVHFSAVSSSTVTQMSGLAIGFWEAP